MRTYWGMKDARPLLLTLLEKRDKEGKETAFFMATNWLAGQMEIKNPSAEQYMEDILNAGYIKTNRFLVSLTEMGKKEIERLRGEGRIREMR